MSSQTNAKPISNELHLWAQQALGTRFEVEQLPKDASKRNYFRLSDGIQSWILMDSSDEPMELLSYLKVGQTFKSSQIHVPEVFAYHEELSACIISDMGRHTYRDVISLDNCEPMMADALQALVKIQRAPLTDVPTFDRQIMSVELNMSQHWFMEKLCQVDFTSAQKRLLKQTYNRLILSALAQPTVTVHRDYHSENLMACDLRPGVIDFQSAVRGPVTYDLVCLLRDARLQWPEEKVLKWAVAYHKLVEENHVIAPVSRQQFLHWFDWMGIQVHLKVLGIFARLYIRDGKAKYLKFIPTGLTYLDNVCERYSVLTPFRDLIGELSSSALARLETIEL